LEDLLTSLILLTKIPISKYRNDANPPDITRAQWAFPLVGALVGFITIFVTNSFSYIGLNNIPSSVIGIMAGLLIIGAFHEKGSAVFLNDFKGGINNQQKLEKIKNINLQNYGTLGLIIAILLKVSLVADLLDTPGCFLMIIGSFALGRTSIVILRKFSTVASGDSSVTLIGKSSFQQSLIAIVLGAIWLIPISLSLALISTLVMLLLILGIRSLATKQIGGISEDILGTSVQIVEISTLIIFNLWI